MNSNIPFLQDPAESVFLEMPIGKMFGKPTGGFFLGQGAVSRCVNYRDAESGFNRVQHALIRVVVVAQGAETRRRGHPRSVPGPHQFALPKLPPTKFGLDRSAA